MAFLDDLSKKITQAGQTAVQKTKDVTDVARLNGVVSEEEKKINNYYYQIGKLYVAMHVSDYEADFEGMITAIRESEQKIADSRQQIQDIKGVVRCEKCGAEVSTNFDFCSSCGAPMPKRADAADANMVKCSGCGQMVPKNMRFCISCGKRMGDIAQAQPAAAEVQPPVVQMSNKCPNCGTEMSADSVFCTCCGTKLK